MTGIEVQEIIGYLHEIKRLLTWIGVSIWAVGILLYSKK